MAAREPFADVEEVQDGIRSTLRALADAVTVIANLEGVPETTRGGLIDREVNEARSQISSLRLRERMALDQAAAQLEAAAKLNGAPIWAESERQKASGDPRRPDRVREALLVEMVKANARFAFGDAPPEVLLHRLRLALRADDFTTVETLKDVALRLVVATGHPAGPGEVEPDTPSSRRHLLRSELGAVYAGYGARLGELLDAIAAVDEARLPPEGRRARRLVETGQHRRPALDLAVWAGDDPLLGAVVERLGEV